MNAAPTRRWKFLFLVPSFLVIRGTVHWNQGGVGGILELGRTLSYKKHGQFEVEHAGEDYAIIHHTTIRGETKKVFIPPRKRLCLSNGQWEIHAVNYQSFLDWAVKNGL